MTEPDFEALRAERNRVMKQAMDEFARAFREMLEDLRRRHGPDACYCACGSGGPCEHRWDGEVMTFPGGSTATCSRCGDSETTHSLRVRVGL